MSSNKSRSFGASADSGRAAVTDYGAPEVDFDQIEGLLREDPNNPELLDIAAFAHYCADNLQRARALYERLVDLFPDMPSHHFYLGNTFFRLGNLTRAHEEWRRTIALDTNGEFARKSKARLGGTATDGSGKL